MAAMAMLVQIISRERKKKFKEEIDWKERKKEGAALRREKSQGRAPAREEDSGVRKS
jgi:hypothetical protein